MNKTKFTLLLAFSLFFSQTSTASHSQNRPSALLPTVITLAAAAVVSLVALPITLVKKHKKKSFIKKIKSFAAENKHVEICELLAKQDKIAPGDWRTFLEEHSPLTLSHKQSRTIQQHMNVPRLRGIFKACPTLRQHFLENRKTGDHNAGSLAIISEIYIHELPADDALIVETAISDFAKDKQREVYGYAEHLPNNIYKILS